MGYGRNKRRKAPSGAPDTPRGRRRQPSSRLFRNIKRLVLALMAFDPELCHQAIARQKWDSSRVLTMMAQLHEPQPGLKWALVERGDGWVSVYDDLLEAAEDCDLDHQALVACKVGEGKLSLRLDGKWVAVEATQAPN
jgi:hypothetical protein